MDDNNLEELKKQAVVDNSKLEELLEKGLTLEMHAEFLETLKESQLYLPVVFSQNMFEGIEDAKPGDIFEPTGPSGFDINYLTDSKANKVVPLFTSDEAMDAAGLRSSVMVMHVSDLVDMLKESDRYSAVAFNPLTGHDFTMPMEGFLNLFNEPTEEEKEFLESLKEILKELRQHSYELEKNMVFFIRSDNNLMKESAVDGVVSAKMPITVSRNPDVLKDLKYTSVLLFDKGKKVLPIVGKVPDDLDTIIAPGTQFKIEEEVDEFTTIWKCGDQPFYDEDE